MGIRCHPYNTLALPCKCMTITLLGRTHHTNSLSTSIAWVSRFFLTVVNSSGCITGRHFCNTTKQLCQYHASHTHDHMHDLQQVFDYKRYQSFDYLTVRLHQPSFKAVRHGPLIRPHLINSFATALTES